MNDAIVLACRRVGARWRGCVFVVFVWRRRRRRLHRRRIEAVYDELLFARASFGASLVRIGPLHEQNDGQEVDEDDAHPGRHGVRARRAIVPVDDDHRVEYGHDVHHEREYEILGDERYDHGRGRQYLRDEQQEHDQGEQDRDTECHLFALVRGQVEDEQAEEADQHGGYDQVDGVEERLAADLELVDELHAIRLVHVLDLGGRAYDVPRAAHQVVGQIDHRLGAPQLHLLRVECPRAEAHQTRLLVEGKVLDVDGARALVDGRRHPLHVCAILVVAVGLYERVGLVAGLVVAVGVVEQHNVGRPHLLRRHGDGRRTEIVVVGLKVELKVLPAQHDPHVRLHDLLLLDHVDELYEREVHLDDHLVVGVLHRPYELVVALEEVAYQALLLQRAVYAVEDDTARDQQQAHEQQKQLGVTHLVGRREMRVLVRGEAGDQAADNENNDEYVDVDFDDDVDDD